MEIIIDIPEARYKDIQRIADAQLEMNHFQTAEQIISKGVPLEHEPILDKIRAEIEELKNAPPCFDDMFEYKYAVDDVLAIIDKYKAESDKGSDSE